MFREEEFLMKYLFIVNIGPVQSFIASARRTRDLHFGSWLLSELAKAAAKYIAENNGELVFPAPEHNDTRELRRGSKLNVANKIVAVIATDSPELMGNNIYQAILDRLLEFTDTVFAGLRAEEDFNREAALRQIKDLIEYFWAAYPFDNGATNKNTYEDTRKKVESLMAARKNTRNFQAVSWGSPQPKSSIDGQLESVIPGKAYMRQGSSERTQANQFYRKYYARPTEFLSGVDLLKRLGSRPDASRDFEGISVPSTSHVATISYLERLESLAENEKVQAREKWDTYISKLQQNARERGLLIDIEPVPQKYRKHEILGRNEGSLLFEERLVDMVDDTKGFETAIQELHKFFSYVDKVCQSPARPYPYYAILHADGDRMGRVISKLAKGAEGLKNHRELSQALDSFARKVSSIVQDEKNKGALVYSGGDDVLAFLPLHTALTCAKQLAVTFAKDLAAFKDEQGNSPTLSVGLAIVHHLHPLSDVLNIARAAEARAKGVPDRKDVPGKNALAITVRKRSGGEYTVADHWNVLDTQIEAFSNDFAHDAIPEGTAYELREMVLRLTELPVSSDNAETLQNAIQAEARRILQRKLRISLEMLSRQDNKDEDEVRIQIYRRMVALFDTEVSPVEASMGQQEDGPASKRIEQLVNMLLVAQLLADAKKMAKPRINQSQEQSGVA